jgi:hypothetical protein
MRLGFKCAPEYPEILNRTDQSSGRCYFLHSQVKSSQVQHVRLQNSEQCTVQTYADNFQLSYDCDIRLSSGREWVQKRLQ